eukprot:TRINITY_DN121903_c0_g1_i1.p1 TRINITY_DN121903_c0_g1~~TRINITY_DN121903_c0_g1_i1.p1  ORF type:complete len:1143 (-),score=143.98 TRINITY_DN121903_c0_g1_i1:117-3545(-)
MAGVETAGFPSRPPTGALRPPVAVGALDADDGDFAPGPGNSFATGRSFPHSSSHGGGGGAGWSFPNSNSHHWAAEPIVVDPFGNRGSSRGNSWGNEVESGLSAALAGGAHAGGRATGWGAVADVYGAYAAGGAELEPAKTVPKLDQVSGQFGQPPGMSHPEGPPSHHPQGGRRPSLAAHMPVVQQPVAAPAAQHAAAAAGGRVLVRGLSHGGQSSAAPSTVADGVAVGIASPMMQVPVHRQAPSAPHQVRSVMQPAPVVTRHHEARSAVQPLMLAERYVADYNRQPAARTPVMQYPSGTNVDVLAVSQQLGPVVAANAAHRNRILPAIESGDLVRRTMNIYTACDRNLKGYLSWDNGEIQEFILAVFQQQGLSPPTSQQMYQLYQKFDADRDSVLDARECLCLVDALFRSIFHAEHQSGRGAPESPRQHIHPGGGAAVRPRSWSPAPAHLAGVAPPVRARSRSPSAYLRSGGAGTPPRPAAATRVAQHGGPHHPLHRGMQVPGAAASAPTSCPHCGNIFMADSNFCRKCGQPRPGPAHVPGAMPVVTAVPTPQQLRPVVASAPVLPSHAAPLVHHAHVLDGGLPQVRIAAGGAQPVRIRRSPLQQPGLMDAGYHPHEEDLALVDDAHAEDLASMRVSRPPVRVRPAAASAPALTLPPRGGRLSAAQRPSMMPHDLHEDDLELLGHHHGRPPPAAPASAPVLPPAPSQQQPSAPPRQKPPLHFHEDVEERLHLLEIDLAMLELHPDAPDLAPRWFESLTFYVSFHPRPESDPDDIELPLDPPTHTAEGTQLVSKSLPARVPAVKTFRLFGGDDEDEQKTKNPVVEYNEHLELKIPHLDRNLVAYLWAKKSSVTGSEVTLIGRSLAPLQDFSLQRRQCNWGVFDVMEGHRVAELRVKYSVYTTPGPVSKPSFVLRRREDFTFEDEETVEQMQKEGAPHPFLYTIRWSPPQNDHGSPVVAYCISILLKQQGSQEPRWVTLCPRTTSTLCEFVVNSLNGNTLYKLDVQAINKVGVGDSCEFTGQTAPVEPAPPGRPYLNEARDGCLNIAWRASPSDGGAPITAYKLRMRKIIGASKWNYFGPGESAAKWVDMGTVGAAQQTPTNPHAYDAWVGPLEHQTCEYRFQVVALNSIGSSEGSELSEPHYT